MVHHRERLAFGLEAGDDAPGVHPELDDLEGDPSSHRLLLLGHVDDAAPSLADFLQQLVAADPLPHGVGRREHRRGDEERSARALRLGLRGWGQGRGLEEGADPLLLGEEGLHLAEDLRGAGSCRFEQGGPGRLVLLVLEGEEEFPRACPGRG